MGFYIDQDVLKKQLEEALGHITKESVETVIKMISGEGKLNAAFFFALGKAAGHHVQLETEINLMGQHAETWPIEKIREQEQKILGEAQKLLGDTLLVFMTAWIATKLEEAKMNQGPPGETWH